MVYVFDDDYELDLQRYELRYAGKLVKLEPQVFNILVYLIEHRERVVTKEELLEQLWSGRVVGEAALTSRLTAARKAIGDSGREQRMIQTVHGRGYRFMAPVTVADVPLSVHVLSSPPLGSQRSLPPDRRRNSLSVGSWWAATGNWRSCTSTSTNPSRARGRWC